MFGGPPPRAGFLRPPASPTGLLADDDGNDGWNQAQRARWTAEDAVDRVKRILPTANTSVNLAQALIWAGYANRLLGENFCDGVINSGPKEPYTVYLDRAERIQARAEAIQLRASRASRIVLYVLVPLIVLVAGVLLAPYFRYWFWLARH